MIPFYKDMMMNIHNSLIYESITNYIKLEAPEFAILLKGKWGIGKTTFISKILANLDKQYIYMSLNGVSSVSELYDLLFESCFIDKLEDDASSSIVNIRAFSKNIIRGFSKYLKLDIDSEKILESFKLTRDKLLVFDDIERFSMPLESIFGFINQFVEHKENHVILIANEEEIIKAKNSEDNVYVKIKEKIIGKEFNLEPELNEVLDPFIEELITNDDLKEIILEDKFKSLIFNILIKSKCQNLRILRMALCSFQDFSSQILDITKQEKNEFLYEILRFFLMLYIESKLGRITKNDFIIQKDEYEYKCIKKIRDIYSVNTNSFILDIPIWEKILFDGVIDSKLLQKEVELNNIYNPKVENEWQILWGFSGLNRKECMSALKKVKDNLKINFYDDIYVITHLVGIFIELRKYGVIKGNKSIADYFIKYIKDNRLPKMDAIQNLRQYTLPSMNISSHGLCFHSNDTDEFKKFIKKRDDRIDEIKNNIFKNNAKQFFNNPYEYAKDKLNSERVYNTPLLSFINIKLFVNRICKLNGVQLTYVLSLLELSSRFLSDNKEEMRALDSFKNKMKEKSEMKSISQFDKEKINEAMNRVFINK
jgi:hypothetical protein